MNCGTTNNELASRICRKCGALLPVPSKSTRARITKVEAETQEASSDQIQVKLDLREIPQEKVMAEQNHEYEETTDQIQKMEQDHIVTDEIIEQNQIYSEVGRQALQEITPKPFQGSILDSPKSNISDAFTELKRSVLESNGKESIPKPPLAPIPLGVSKSEVDFSKKKKLEKDMTDVLSFLSKKISVKKLETSIPKAVDIEKPEEKIPPASMNEILEELTTLDSHIEASAIIKTDGTILASGISSRISESLFTTIGMNLSMISSDIIEGLSAGTLKSISVRGTEGVLDLAPIDREAPNLKDLILILFSHPKVKSGILSIAVNIVKKQIKFYLGLEK
jgi:predicted regulator of Ras-like GTPase activity (Roadblock/LC7/MglB family)